MWQSTLKCKISWRHTPDYTVVELLPSDGTGGCKEEVGCRGRGPRIPALHIRGLSERRELVLLLAQARLLWWSHEPIPPARAAPAASDEPGRQPACQGPIRAEDAAIPGDGPIWPRSHCPHLTPQGPPGKKGPSHEGQAVLPLSSQKAPVRELGEARRLTLTQSRINVAVLVGAEPSPQNHRLPSTSTTCFSPMNTILKTPGSRFHRPCESEDKLPGNAWHHLMSCIPSKGWAPLSRWGLGGRAGWPMHQEGGCTVSSVRWEGGGPWCVGETRRGRRNGRVFAKPTHPPAGASPSRARRRLSALLRLSRCFSLEVI